MSDGQRCLHAAESDCPFPPLLTAPARATLAYIEGADIVRRFVQHGSTPLKLGLKLTLLQESIGSHESPGRRPPRVSGRWPLPSRRRRALMDRRGRTDE